MDKQRIGIYRSFIHPFISVFIPFVFIWTLQSVLSNFVPIFTRIPNTFPLILLLSVVSESVVGNYLYKERIGGFIPRLRELLVILVFSFALILLLQGDIFRGNGKIVRFEILFPLVEIVVAWIFAYYIHAKLRDRELFLGMLVGVEPRNLAKTFRDFHFEAGQCSDGIRAVRRVLVGLHIVILVLLILSTALEGRIANTTFALVIVNFIFGFIFYLTLNGFLQGQSLSGEGYSVPKEIQSRRFRIALMVVVIGALLTVPLVREKPFIPSSVISKFMLWLDERLSWERLGPLTTTRRESQESQPLQQNMDSGGADFAGVGSENKAIQKVIRIIIISLLVGIPGVVLFFVLVLPLFRRQEAKVHVFKMLMDWFSRFWSSIVASVRSLVSAFRGFQRRAERQKRIFENLFGGGETAVSVEEKSRGSSLFRKLTLARNIKTFLKLIRWGEKRGTKFSTYLGPKEYLHILGRSFPDLREALSEIAELFEEQLFSLHEITDKKNTAYYDRVRLVLRYR